MKTPGPKNLKLQRAHGKRPLEPADAAGIDTIGWVLLTGVCKKYVYTDVRTYLVEVLNLGLVGGGVRSQEENLYDQGHEKAGRESF